MSLRKIKDFSNSANAEKEEQQIKDYCYGCNQRRLLSIYEKKALCKRCLKLRIESWNEALQEVTTEILHYCNTELGCEVSECEEASKIYDKVEALRRKTE